MGGGFRVVEEFRFSMVEGPLTVTIPANYYEGDGDLQLAAFLKSIASRYRALGEDEGYDEQSFHLEIAAGMVAVQVPVLCEGEPRLAVEFLMLVAKVFRRATPAKPKAQTRTLKQ